MQTASPRNYVDKTFTGSTVTVNGTLRADCDVLAPVIEITGAGIAENVLACNYMYIPDFSRYYYVSARVIRNNLYQLTGKVDVLYTYREAIKQCVGVVARAENGANIYVPDAARTLTAERIIEPYYIPPAADGVHFAQDEQQGIILIVAGNSYDSA